MNARNVLLVFFRDAFVFKKAFTVATALLLAEPIFTMLAFGLGVGSLIGKVNGLSYLEFYFVGRLSNTALIATYSEATGGLFSKIHLDGSFSSASIAGIQVHEMFWGELLWITFRSMYVVLLSWLVFCLMGSGSWSAISIMPFLMIDTIIVAAVGMALTVCVESSNSFFFSNIGFILPLSLFSGAFFPVEVLPGPVYYLTIIFPQANVIALCRSLLAGQYTDPAVYSQISILFVYLFVSVYFARKLFIQNIKI